MDFSQFFKGEGLVQDLSFAQTYYFIFITQSIIYVSPYYAVQWNNKIFLNQTMTCKQHSKWLMLKLSGLLHQRQCCKLRTSGAEHTKKVTGSGGQLPTSVSPILESKSKERCLSNQDKEKGVFFSTRKVEQQGEMCQFNFTRGEKTRYRVY